MCLDRCDVCVCRLWDWTLSERSQEQEVTVDDVFVTGVMFVCADSGIGHLAKGARGDG